MLPPRGRCLALAQYGITFPTTRWTYRYRPCPTRLDLEPGPVIFIVARLAASRGQAKPATIARRKVGGAVRSVSVPQVTARCAALSLSSSSGPCRDLDT